ncbi:hypothetical protein KXD93_03840 [Mucilaginibacter sp. BJC16-A38]|nr:hypothetical protein [Mucilaginibacter phenanthrenivorans]MCR8556754.1 hypothetical protein [Mucilaginibacter phenanthrenivorans]
MKNKEIKDFDTVKTFREIKEKISNEIQGMNFEQLTAYLGKAKLKVQK